MSGLSDYQDAVRMVSCGIMQSRSVADVVYYMLIIVIKLSRYLKPEDFERMAQAIRKANPQNKPLGKAGAAVA